MRPLLLLLLVAAVAPARPPAPMKKGVDLHGDPLPPGAVARLGTVRFRGTAAAYSPDGAVIATSSPDGVRLWDVKTGVMRQHIPMKGSPEVLVFSPDGTRLATVLDQGMDAEVWGVNEGKRLHSFAAPEEERSRSRRFNRAGAARFSPTARPCSRVTGGPHPPGISRRGGL